ncbi:Cytochrome bo(3) ubiquinol oxidase subunit 1 [Buchnera aphidicola (Cinara cuneomaculata)]|uniref:Cytochrome bo(3) ubiquinol oxidase subunit 1 n=1 Tax=Buchnera aphidicola (Cinara cuneomaculata) TaxID=1660040 RepID=A0A451CYM7_9GAMM|nr:cytochrome o ubiquinol oxidase subunit I [Buchnera aphidicola]VFP78278.1 Cytochrome bo(3) ubiquinol oxidase subunit 1 [Buchnera aphidicola (Cinara cuneomaculata)]
MFGKLTINAIPFHDPIIMITYIVIILFSLTLGVYITYLKKWNYLWRNWFTSVDHKKIAVMYFILSFVMFLRGFSDAVIMRLQQFFSSLPGGHINILPANHYDQVFTAHGVIMIFFVAMPLVIGLMNFVIPLQIGARDLAFPLLNNLSFWLTASSVFLMMLSLGIGEFAATGWLGYPPLSGIQYSPGVGVDYWIWILQISGLGTILTAINFIVTIINFRAPGMTMFKMPVFTWTALCTNILILISFPVLFITLVFLSLDRYLGFHFFTNDLGGNMMLYINLIWIWGHPEVYILILPIFGIFSEIVSTFSRKALFGYISLIWATIVITILSFLVWLHHFFTMGAGADVNSFFSITTMIIAIPTGVKIFNWLFTMYRGRIVFHSAMLWTIGFLVSFTVGGMAGVLLSIPSIDFVFHNSLFLVAHFHNVIIGGVVFGCFAGITYWFPKIFGFKLNEYWGKVAFLLWINGFFIAFIPLYILGCMGMTRRLSQNIDVEYHNLLTVAAIGSIIIFLGIVAQLIQLFISIKNRHSDEYRDDSGDPWNGRTLEWSILSPPPVYNFAVIPLIKKIDNFWYEKINKNIGIGNHFESIHMPNNTSTGIIISVLTTIFGFSMIWHIWWLVFLSLIGIFFIILIKSLKVDNGYIISKNRIYEIENKYKSTNKKNNHK